MFCEAIAHTACVLSVCHEHVLPRSHKVMSFAFQRQDTPRPLSGKVSFPTVEYSGQHFCLSTLE